jgi:hypothetical protein
MTKKYLYKDLNGDLFKITSKKDHKVYIQKVSNLDTMWVNELAFNSLFVLTNMEIDKYEKGSLTLRASTIILINSLCNSCLVILYIHLPSMF